MGTEIPTRDEIRNRIITSVRRIHHYGDPPDLRLADDVTGDVADIMDLVDEYAALASREQDGSRTLIGLRPGDPMGVSVVELGDGRCIASIADIERLVADRLELLRELAAVFPGSKWAEEANRIPRMQLSERADASKGETNGL